MDDNERIIVDFVIPVEPDLIEIRPAAGVRLHKCVCGGDHFVLASEMIAQPGKGIPSSRMFECTGCGEYRLG